MREVKRQEHGLVSSPAVHGVQEAAVVTTTFKDLNSPAYYVVTVHDQVHYRGGSAKEATGAVQEFISDGQVEPWPEELPLPGNELPEPEPEAEGTGRRGRRIGAEEEKPEAESRRG